MRRAHPAYCIEPCPKCGFEEADGGYCEACSWSLPWPGEPGGERLYPPGTCHGPVYKHGQLVSPGFPPKAGPRAPEQYRGEPLDPDYRLANCPECGPVPVYLTRPR